jgi:2-polyprenyl-6-methoxyphenol hydroxylase-like FAD-dependent oxidoreductase
MSPAGGVGVNLAVQDAVATANLLAAKLRQGKYELEDLLDVQQRREMPARLIQNMQVYVHRRMFGAASGLNDAFSLPWPVPELIGVFAPFLRQLAARVIGVGFRPEHIRT